MRISDWSSDVCSSDLFERFDDIIFAQRTKKDGITECSVFVKRFIHHIPGVDFTVVSAGYGFDVSLEELPDRIHIFHMLHESRQLAMPNQGMTIYLHVVLGCISYKAIGLIKFIMPPSWL